MEGRTVDIRFQIRGPLREQSRVVVVAIDNATEMSWRDTPKAMWGSRLAALVKRLDTAGAKRIGLDFLISVDPDNYLSSKGIDETPNADLDRAIIEFGERVVLGTARANDVAPPLNQSERLASVNRTSIESGVVRQVPRIDSSFSPPLIGIALALADDIDNRIDPVNINYSGRKLAQVSARDVLENRFPTNMFRGAIVLIGETYEGTSDLHQTPYGWTVPGVIIHAEATRTLLDHNELRVWPNLMSALFSAFVSLCAAILSTKVMVGRFLTITAPLALTWTVVCFLAFKSFSIAMPWLVPVMMSLVLTPSVIYALRAIEEYQEHLFARMRWGQLVGESTVQRLEKNRKTGRGAWETFDCCLLFLDICDFSEMLRTQGTSTTIDRLNKLFALVDEKIVHSGGEVINFIGDGIAAKWEFDSLESRELRKNVLQVALKILEELDRLNARGEFGAQALAVRIGLSFGQTTLALIGSSGRQQMTLYGEAVNLAARLEAVGKENGIHSKLVVSSEFEDSINAQDRKFVMAQRTFKGWKSPLDFFFLEEELTEKGN